ncbi:MAG: hypothetical protein ACLUEC_10465 [Coprococcus sp.]
MEDILNEVYKDLVVELRLVDESDKGQLYIKVKNAIREVVNRRAYPSHFSKEDIRKDLEMLYSNIHDIALYDYNQIGVEGQVSHSDNTNTRTWKDREECLKGVFAWAGF